ncbi:MAG: VWA domain-containing protein, partial [Clostridiales bacterium]|nr:VWA domain-containing protein [Clostridiales bacterium]
MLFSIGVSPAYAQGTGSAPYPTAFSKASDPDTSNVSGIFSSSTLENGRLWTDKSVNAGKAVIYDTAGNAKGSVTADPDQFLVNLSALSEGYSLDSTVQPIDAVFIIDLSGSMTYGFADNTTEGAQGARRVDAMTDSLNEAIRTLMDANPNNRVAVVAYGGLSGRVPMTYSFLGLDHYNTVSAGQPFFSVDYGGPGLANFSVTPNVTDSGGTLVSPVQAPVSGGTPTQRGIWTGSQVLMNNTVTTYTDPAGNTVARKPVMILMTDGEPTFGWKDYKDPFNTISSPPDYDAGDAITPDLGIDSLTVATASYWKQQVQDHYTTLSAPYPVNTAYYTIGVYMDNAHTRAVLDPGGIDTTTGNTNAANDIQDYVGDTTIAGAGIPAGSYNMQDILDAFVTPPGGTDVGFPILPAIPYPIQFGVGAAAVPYPRTSMQIQNGPTATPDFVTSYDYSDGYFQAKDAGALKDAFANIASQMISQGSYITNVNPNSPDYSGYLTFSDVIGRYMEVKSFKGLWYDDTQYDGASFAQYVQANNGVASQTFLDGLATQMGETDQVAADVVKSSFLGGSLYYNGPNDYGDQIKYYADNHKYYVGPYYDASGALAPQPSNAMCVMDLYTVEGDVASSVTGAQTSLTTINFVVLTALKSGQFDDADDGNAALVRTLIAGQQIVRWYIPAPLIPLRTIKADVVNSKIVGAEIKEVSPIHAIYAVGLQNSLTLDKIDA